jgi:hypothetical protein
MTHLEFDPARSRAVRELLVERASTHAKLHRPPIGAQEVRPDRPRRFISGPALTTAAVAILLAVGTVLTVRVTTPSQSGPATSTAPSASASSDLTTAQLQTAIFERLTQDGASESDLLHARYLTWTEHDLDPRGGPLVGSTEPQVLVAACEGGGSITIHIPGKRPRILKCAHLATLGPIDLTSTELTTTLRITSTGNPNYTVKAVSISPDPAPTK